MRLMPLLASEERLGSEALGAGGGSPEPRLLLSCLLSLGCSGAASLAALSDSEIEGVLSGGDAIAAKCRGRERHCFAALCCYDVRWSAGPLICTTPA